ncbi:MAG: T9SS type A sorting domain-containing protein, partial [Candidatus Cloacimonetes bacterium]|nr:T9SS type A sorting domain-containing protein [Candidatus Cloacimonadota bacterium]
TITINEITNAPTDVIANAGRLNVAISWTAPNNSSPDLIRQNGSRALLSYDIWRALEGDTDDWTVVATNLTNTSFIDASWRHAELGNYVYMVRANYSGGVVSENAVSNTVERDVIYNSISGIVLASGENIGLAGATITLEGIEIYTTTSSATGAYSFEQVIANRNYTLTIEKDNYITHTGEIVTVFADIVIPTITLQEITNPPTDVVASANQNQVELAWEAPDNSRAMLDYIIWRAEQGSSSNEDTWLEIASAITTTSYTDESWANIEPGTYVYIVKARYSGDVLSEAAYSNIVEKEVSADINPIYATKLHKNYPNPFNPSTTISFSVIEATHVKIEIYNTAGQKVRTLVNDVRAIGNHSIVWNGHDDSGKNVGSGVYFYRMTTPKFSATQKMLLMK